MEKYITKTLGNGEEISVPNPDLYNDEGDYQKHKYRRVLNWQPKKKKRKKHKRK